MQYLFVLIGILAVNLTSLDYSTADISFQESTFSQEQMKTVQSLIEGVTDEDLASLEGGKLYKQNCTTCHGRRGGLGISGATNLKKSNIELNQRVAMMYFGKGKMLTYKDALKPEEMVAIATFLESMRK